LNGHLAIATERGVCLYDISAPRAPVRRKLLPGRLSDVCSDGDRTLFVHSGGVTTVFDLSNIDSPRMLGTIGAYFHDLARRGDLVFGVLTGLKVYRLGAGPEGMLLAAGSARPGRTSSISWRRNEQRNKYLFYFGQGGVRWVDAAVLQDARRKDAR
jgi:hypothetical protein